MNLHTILPRIMWIFLILLLWVGTLALGIRIGEQRATHDVRVSNRYNRFFQRGPSIMSDSHGAFGTILSISGDGTLFIQGDERVPEQLVRFTSSTLIRSGRNRVSSRDLRPDMNVGVFGVPDSEGQINAKLIRILPKSNK